MNLSFKTKDYLLYFTINSQISKKFQLDEHTLTTYKYKNYVISIKGKQRKLKRCFYGFSCNDNSHSWLSFTV